MAKRRHGLGTAASLTLIVLAVLAAGPSAAQAPAAGSFARLEARAAGPGEAFQSSDGSAAERVDLEPSLAPALLQLHAEETARVADWPVAPGERHTVLLTRHEVYAAGARIVRVEGRRETELPRSRLAFYWGVGDDDEDVRVFASIDPATGSLEGFAQTRAGLHELRAVGGRHEVAKPETFLPAAATADGPPSWTCGEESLPKNLALPWTALTAQAPAGADALPLATLSSATVAFDTDNELMLSKFNNDTTAATNYLASLVAAIDVMYERDLNIRLVQGMTFLRVSTTADPYVQVDTSGADGNELNEFSTYWGTNYGSVQRMVAAMISGKQGSSNSASGIAWVGGLCSTSFGYSFSQVFKINYLAGDALVVGHEIGHNFGTPHTHCYTPPIDMCFNTEPGCYSGPTSCPAAQTINGVTNVAGTIMSYCHLLGGCTSSMVFHPRTVTLITPDITSALNVCIFPINNSPTVSGVTPRGGTTAGGSPVTITGTNFQAGATVSLGGVAATSVTVVSATKITAVTGAHASGLVSASVTNSGSPAGTLSNAYFYNPPATAATFFTLPPCRMLDTRNPAGPLGGPILAGGSTRTFSLIGACGVPAGATALSVNVTVTSPTAAGFLAIYPGNAIPFGTSAITFSAGQTIANNAMILLATDGSGTVSVQNGGAGGTHVILDVNGYFQ